MRSLPFPRSFAKGLMSALVAADARIEWYELAEDNMDGTSAPRVRARLHLPPEAVHVGIGFDLSLTNLALRSVDAVPRPSTVRPANINDKTWLCALFEFSAPSSIDVMFSFRPLTSDDSRLVLATTSTLPQVLNNPSAGQLPMTLHRGRVFGFLPSICIEGAGSEDRVVHGVWITRSWEHFCEADEGVVLSPSFAEGLSSGEVRRVGSLCRRMLDFFEHLFGTVPGGKLLIARPTESVRAEAPALPGAILGTPSTFGVRNTHIPKDIYHARQVPSHWFGGGIRIRGQKSSALEFAIASAASLHWTSMFGDPDDLERRVSQLRAFEGDARVASWLQTLRGRATAKFITRYTLAFYDAWRTGSAKGDILRSLVHRRWGNVVSSAEVLSVLS
jgi:hypothetical protein